MDIWLAFSGFAYLLVTLSIVIIWKRSMTRKVSLVSIIRQWPFVDKALVAIWVIQLATILYTKNPQSFALNSVLLLYLVGKINKELISRR